MDGRKERRLRPRLNIYFLMRVRPKGSPGEEGDDTFTVNISSEGVYFVSRRKYAPGTILSMHIKLPSNTHVYSDSSICECEAEVVRSESFMKSGEPDTEWTYGVAARFRSGFSLALLAEV